MLIDARVRACHFARARARAHGRTYTYTNARYHVSTPARVNVSFLSSNNVANVVSLPFRYTFAYMYDKRYPFYIRGEQRHA